MCLKFTIPAIASLRQSVSLTHMESHSRVQPFTASGLIKKIAFLIFQRVGSLQAQWSV